MENDLPYWLGFNQTPGVGAKKLRALLDTFGSAQAAWQAPAPELMEAGLDQRSLDNLLKLRETLDLTADLQRLQAADVQVLTWDSPVYPRKLLGIDAPPPVLFMRGELWSSDEFAVAIVGTRGATTYGRECTLRLAHDLARAGVTVVSGLARGIDGVAHHETMVANGRTLAVLGNGLDVIYPPEHRALAHRIMQQGALLSEHMLGVKPDARHFPARNRIISGLSLGVIVVEGRWSSGAVITAKQALEQGREVFAVPGNILSPGSEGPNRLIRDGATPVLSADDVLETLNLRQVADKVDARKTLPEDPIEARIMDLLSAEPRHVDEIRRQTEMPVQEVSSALALMELKGLVRQVGGMQYVVAREPGVVYRIG